MMWVRRYSHIVFKTQGSFFTVNSACDRYRTLYWVISELCSESVSCFIFVGETVLFWLKFNHMMDRGKQVSVKCTRGRRVEVKLARSSKSLHIFHKISLLLFCVSVTMTHCMSDKNLYISIHFFKPIVFELSCLLLILPNKINQYQTLWSSNNSKFRFNM